MGIVHPSRLETRTKESCSHASHGPIKVHGVTKVIGLIHKKLMLLGANPGSVNAGYILLLLLETSLFLSAVCIGRRAPRACGQVPERWWSMRGQGEARGNSGGGPKRFWRANRSSELRIGAKDQSNHLVAGSLRSFPQDSWHLLEEFHPVKRMIRGRGDEKSSAHSQTLNGWEAGLSWFLEVTDIESRCLVGLFW